MDGDRFDALARSLTAARPRRALLGAALAGLLALRAAPEAGAACLPAGQACDPQRPGACCSKKCPTRTKRCACTAATCPPPANPCKQAACVNGRCGAKNRPDDAACDGTGRCLAGRCNAQPVCSPVGTNCPSASAPPCCSGRCAQNPTTGAYRCAPGAPGAPCLGGADCYSGGCVGYRCTRRDCVAGDDGCLDRAKTCGDQGICLTPSGGGTRCGVQAPPPEGACDRCQTDEQCQAALGNPAAFCARGGTLDGHPSCVCDRRVRFCAVPA